MKPKHIAIVGLGPSSADFLDACKRLGGRHQYCDEVWGINALGDVLACDRIYHMDDVRIQEIRAAAEPEGNIAAMLKWLKRCTIPVTTSRTHPNYAALEAFPLEEVLSKHPQAYFNSTAAYAVAGAIHAGAAKISMFGCDFSYPDAHDAEKGRACVEFWLGIAAAQGIQIAMPKATTLMDACYTHSERFYGFDLVTLKITGKPGAIKVEQIENRVAPTAAEIERAYDHSRPISPNALKE